MKESDTKSRQRKCSANHFVNAYSFYTLLLGSHCEQVFSCSSTITKSCDYDGIVSTRSYVSIFRIRGGEEEEALFGHLHHLSLDIADTTTSAYHDRTSIFTSTLKHNRGLWRRIRLLRGGVYGEKGEDRFDEAKCNDAKSKSSTTTSVTEDTSDIFATDRQDTAPTHYSWQEKSGSVLSSFLSRFRAPVETSNYYTIQRTTNTSGIAHKMPHGPDGRGGGMAVVSDHLHESSTEREREEDFVIITEITNADVLVDDPMSNTGKKASAKDSAAFVFPPNTLPSNVETRKEEDTKMGKASKISPPVVGVNASTDIRNISISKAPNETDMIIPYKGETRNNTIVHVSLLGEAPIAGKLYHGLELKDYTSSGYVSRSALFVFAFLYMLLSQALQPLPTVGRNRSVSISRFIIGYCRPQTITGIAPCS